MLLDLYSSWWDGDQATTSAVVLTGSPIIRPRLAGTISMGARLTGSPRATPRLAGTPRARPESDG